MERSRDNMLAFLDCLVEREVDGTFNTSIYRKPTHTDQYLLFDSCHPLEHTLGVIRTLVYRADTVCSTECRVQSEKTHIKEALRKCGYPNWAFGEPE